MNRSGKLIATNDTYIKELVQSPLYEVRRDGTVWTKVHRNGWSKSTLEWRKLGWVRNKYAVLKYKQKGLQIHRIIYQKYVGELISDLVVNHIDGNCFNNVPENLEQITQGANNLHAFRVLQKRPSIGNVKLTYEIAKQIRQERALGTSYKQLSSTYHISFGHISEIIHNRIWKDSLHNITHQVTISKVS